MSRLVPEHFNQRGRPKRSFATQGKARNYLAEKGWTGLYGYYECPLCLKWHLTSRKYKRKSDLPRRF